MPILNNSPDLIRSNNINDLMKFIDKIKISLKENNNNNITNIWDLAEKYKNISLDILTYDKWFKKPYHIHQLMEWFKGDNLFICI